MGGFWSKAVGGESAGLPGMASLLAILVAIVVAIAGGAAEGRRLPPIDAQAAVPAAETNAAAGSAATVGDADGTLRVVHHDARHDLPTLMVRETAAANPIAAAAALPRVPRSRADYSALARTRLRAAAASYRIEAAEVDALPIHDVHLLPAGGAIVRFRNRIDGVEVFREEANVLVGSDGVVAAIGGYVTGAGNRQPRRAAALTRGPADAVATALSDFGFPAAAADRFLVAAGAGDYAVLTLPAQETGAGGAQMAIPARARPVWFRLGGDLVAAHYVEVEVRDDGGLGRADAYAYVVSSADGVVLYRHSLTADAAFTYRVYAEAADPFLPLPGPVGRAALPHPDGAPIGYQPPYVAANLVTLQGAPFGRGDPWLPDGATTTSGNNVDAFADIAGPDRYGPADPAECDPAVAPSGDFHACTNGPRRFDYAYDPQLEPDASRAQAMAAVTNLFYITNYLHDWYYAAGFDEVAGNAQNDNYGRGGVAGDALYAEAHDYAGSNNADMTTPSDGGRPRMRMFLWSNGSALASVGAPPAVAGIKEAGIAQFGPLAFDLAGELALARDAADVDGPTTTDGCSPYANANAVAGKIAVVDRGTCLFVVKARRAQDAGAVALLVINNVEGSITMAGNDPAITIPIVSVSLADGTAIKAELARPTPVSMRLARKSSVQRDGAIDNTLIAHEWGHYISNRLVANANGFTTNQAEGLGEGFADFHALLLLVKDADRLLPGNADFGGAYPITAYTMSGPDFAPDVIGTAWYYGVRRYPYSRDLERNPLTLRHIVDGVALPAVPATSPSRSGGTNSEPHNTGEVWGSLLWECYGNLLGDSKRLAFADAQDRMKRYLVAAYKLMPANPTFVEARDALLAVIGARDATDRDLCLHGFARRGAGVGAVAPDRNAAANRGVVESYLSVLPAGGARRPAVEYYHAGFDHYFVTDIPTEVDALDRGVLSGWTRTGESFNVYADAPRGSAPVCRFFSTAFGSRSSHFYTPDANECAGLKRDLNWQLEAIVFATPLPGPTGACPAGSQPVFRLYNGGAGGAPNHRYTTSSAIRAQMLAKGWVAEGYGAAGAVMCAPD
jgi:hypothetical protein